MGNMQFDKSRPCFWFPPDLKCPPDGGYYQLGTLIVDPDFLHLINMRDENPNDGMFYPARLPGNAMDSAEPLTKHNITPDEATRTVDDKSDIDFSMTILTSAIREFAVKTTGTYYSPEHHAVVSAVLPLYLEGLRSVDINLTDDYVKASLLRPKVQEQLREWRFRKRQYMITGFRVAIPASEEKMAEALKKLDDIEWVNSVPPSTEAAEFKLKKEKIKRKMIKEGAELAAEVRKIFEHISREPFVYAMRLRECRYGRKAKAGGEVRMPEGLSFANDKEMKEESPDDYEFVSCDVEHEDMNVSSFAGAHGEHTVVDDRLVDDVGQVPCYLHGYMFTAMAMAGDLRELG